MPLFDLRCLLCYTVQRDVVLEAGATTPLCPHCGGGQEKVWLHSPAVRSFHSGMYEHVADTPMYFDSREKLKNYVKENGMYMDYVDGH